MAFSWSDNSTIPTGSNGQTFSIPTYNFTYFTHYVPRETIKVVVTGSRQIIASEIAVRMAEVFSIWIDRCIFVHMIHGGAQGVDCLAGNLARDRGWKVDEYKPDYVKYGPKAPLIRNKAMIDQKPDLVLAFWDGKSTGTMYTIELAKKKGIPVVVHRFDPVPNGA